MTDLNTQMSGESLSIAEQRKQELKQLFPGVFTEIKNDKGEIVEAIDYERLKAELGNFSEIYDNRRERYGMDWPGKRDCLRLIQEPSRATLKPCRDESVEFDKTENLFIEGDNLEVLKLLQKAYYGKIKMIYIDPPYNTGKEFIYPDNFSESLETYLSYAGLSGDDGKKFSTNSANEGRFHTKWLNMMFPRLYLARNLLREDGVIFISIDDNEVQNLRRVCDEIFGEENFIANIVWQKKYAPQNDSTYFSDMHDHILVYAKVAKKTKNDPNGWALDLLPRTDSQNSAYKNMDNDPRGLWRSDNLSVKTYSSKNDYPITTPSGRVVNPPSSRSWVVSQDRLAELISDNRIWFGFDGDNVPSLKRFLSEVQDGAVPVTWWTYQDCGHNQDAKKELKLLIHDEIDSVFDTPKPTKLIKRMLQLSTKSSPDAIILDFFAGSGSLGHAVMECNKEDGGNRRYILVQLPESIDGSNQSVSDLTKQRLNLAGKKIHEEISGQLDFEGKANLDLGFKVLKLDRSNFKHWQAPAKDIADDELAKQFELHIDHIDPNASQEDILYELLIKAGVMPTKKIELIELANHAVFSVEDGGWLICLQDTIEQSLIDAVLEKEPVQFICLDRAFHGNDQLKANAIATFADFNQGRDKADQIEFRTV